jgi:hypothetical protein
MEKQPIATGQRFSKGTYQIWIEKSYLVATVVLESNPHFDYNSI